MRTKVEPIAEALDFMEAREGKDALDHLMHGHSLKAGAAASARTRAGGQSILGRSSVVIDNVLSPPWAVRTDGAGCCIPGTSHTVVSETEAGKTWLVMAAAWEEMMLDHHVLCIDWQDDEVTARRSAPGDHASGQVASAA